MQLSRLDHPQSVELLVAPWLLDVQPLPMASSDTEAGSAAGSSTPPEDIVIRLVVTNIRAIWVDAGLIPGDCRPEATQQRARHYRYPEYEAEGWLLAPPGNPANTIWVRCALRTNDTERVQECIVFRLQSDEKLGTEPTPGMG
jgi:hypothetical protein